MFRGVTFIVLFSLSVIGLMGVVVLFQLFFLGGMGDTDYLFLCCVQGKEEWEQFLSALSVWSMGVVVLCHLVCMTTSEVWGILIICS